MINQPPTIFDHATACTFVSEVAAELAKAGLEPYVSPAYSDSQLRGLERFASNVQPWSVHDPEGGSPSAFLLPHPKPGEAVIGVEIWGRKGRNRLYDESERFCLDDRAVEQMADQIGTCLRAAGLDVIEVRLTGYDSGWGTYNVGYGVVFRKGSYYMPASWRHTEWCKTPTGHPGDCWMENNRVLGIKPGPAITIEEV